MWESWTKMHKLERDFRAHSYTQLTMSYYSQLGKNKILQSFHDSFACIKCVPEYICTCCDQFWSDHQLQSVMIINTVHQVHKNLIDVCITGKDSVDNTEWVSSTCHSNLSDRKLPVCFKPNKMNFSVKPECLNFTPLEEGLKSLCIPFLQMILCELLEGDNYLFMAMLLMYQLMWIQL